MYDGMHHLMWVNIGSQISQQSDNKTTKYVYHFINIMAILICVVLRIKIA